MPSKQRYRGVRVALFLDYHGDSGAVVTVEVTPEPAEINRLQTICDRLSPKFRAEKIIARQACFRPVTQDGLPLIGRVPQIEGVYVATGHNVWGILNAPATGEALADLIADGVARSIDLTPFDPMRLQPLDPSFLRSS
jgi:glycine/D-amino acid oxidase-like deaminating enzyme